MLNKYFTYLIKDPRDQVPIYVGQTSDLTIRKAQHINVAIGKKPNIGIINIDTYLVDLFEAGFLPDFEIVEECETEEKSLLSETLWINKVVDDGYPVLNRWKTHRAIVKKAFTSKELKAYFSNRFS